jgi:hypothetical protein
MCEVAYTSIEGLHYLLIVLQSGEEFREIGVLVVDMADDGMEGLGSCYQICTRTL